MLKIPFIPMWNVTFDEIHIWYVEGISAGQGLGKDDFSKHNPIAILKLLLHIPSYWSYSTKISTRKTSFILKLHFFPRNLEMKDFLANDPKVLSAHPFTSYDLVANISHDGEPGKC